MPPSSKVRRQQFASSVNWFRGGAGTLYGSVLTWEGNTVGKGLNNRRHVCSPFSLAWLRRVAFLVPGNSSGMIVRYWQFRDPVVVVWLLPREPRANKKD